MRRWRAKLVWLMMVYCSGFLTAIYMLMPPPENAEFSAKDRDAVRNQINFKRVAQKINEGMHKCVNLGKETAGQVAESWQEHMNQTSTSKTEGS